MRVNPNTSQDMLSYLQTAKQQEQSAIEQLASGKRVNVASDDPAAAAADLINNSRSAEDDQFTRNIDTVQQMMNTADSALNSVVTQLTRAISLGVEGGDGTLSTSDRRAIAQEISGIKDQIFGLANTAFEGVFVFGGTASAAAPFVLDATSTSGVRYVGNDNVNNVQIGDHKQVATSVPGDTLFAAAGAGVFGSLQTLASALQSGSSTDVANATEQVRSAFEQVTSSRVFYGNTMNGLQSQEDFLNQDKVNLQQNEDQLIAADPAKAASDLSQAEFARQATLSAAARAQSLSLLDYLR